MKTENAALSADYHFNIATHPKTRTYLIRNKTSKETNCTTQAVKLNTINANKMGLKPSCKTSNGSMRRVSTKWKLMNRGRLARQSLLRMETSE